MVHGLYAKLAGCNPSRKISSETIKVAINSRRFRANMTQIGVSLKLW